MPARAPGAAQPRPLTATARMARAARSLAPGSPRTGPHPVQRRPRPGDPVAIDEQRHRLGRHGLGREGVLDQLGGDPLPGHEVHHRIGVDPDERLAQAVGQRRQAIDHHHRHLVQRGLHGGRARRRQDEVGGREHLVGPRLDEHRRAPPGRIERREERRLEVRGARHHELHARHTIGDQPGGRRQSGQDRPQLVRPASRQQGDGRRRRVEPQPAQEALARLAGRGQIDQRMPHPFHRHASLLVDRRLEGKDDEDPIGNPLHRLHPPGAPGPQLRTDVVDDGNAERPDGGGQPEVEVGEVDGHEDIGTPDAGGVDEPAVHRVRPRQHLQRLGQAGDGEAAIVADEIAAGLPEAFAPEAEQLDRRILAAQRCGSAPRRTGRRTPRRRKA